MTGALPIPDLKWRLCYVRASDVLDLFEHSVEVRSAPVDSSASCAAKVLAAPSTNARGDYTLDEYIGILTGLQPVYHRVASDAPRERSNPVVQVETVENLGELFIRFLRTDVETTPDLATLQEA